MPAVAGSRLITPFAALNAPLLPGERVILALAACEQVKEMLKVWVLAVLPMPVKALLDVVPSGTLMAVLLTVQACKETAGEPVIFIDAGV